MTPERERRLVEEAAARIRAFEAWERAEDSPRAFPGPAAIEVLEAATGGRFTPETARLAARAVARARELAGLPGRAPPEPDAVGREGGIPLYGRAADGSHFRATT